MQGCGPDPRYLGGSDPKGPGHFLDISLLFLVLECPVILLKTERLAFMGGFAQRSYSVALPIIMECNDADIYTDMAGSSTIRNTSSRRSTIV